MRHNEPLQSTSFVVIISMCLWLEGNRKVDFFTTEIIGAWKLIVVTFLPAFHSFVLSSFCCFLWLFLSSSDFISTAAVSNSCVWEKDEGEENKTISSQKVKEALY